MKKCRNQISPKADVSTQNLQPGKQNLTKIILKNLASKNKLISVTRQSKPRTHHPSKPSDTTIWHQTIHQHTIEFSKNTHPPDAFDVKPAPMSPPRARKILAILFSGVARTGGLSEWLGHCYFPGACGSGGVALCGASIKLHRREQRVKSPGQRPSLAPAKLFLPRRTTNHRPWSRSASAGCHSGSVILVLFT